MKHKILLVLMAIALMTMSASATKIYVCGTKITGTTSFSAGGGTVYFNASSNTLTISNVYYLKSGSSNNGISVDECDNNLTINLVGNVTFGIGDADAVLLKSSGKSATITVSGYAHFYTSSSGHAGLKLQSQDVAINGSGQLDIEHINSSTSVNAVNAVKGGTGTENIKFGIKKCTLKSNGARLYNLNDVTFNPTGNFGSDDYSTYITFTYYSSDSSSPHASNISNFYKGTGVKLLKPLSYYNESLNFLTVNNFSTEAVVADVSPVAVFNSSYFPDANFRSYLLGLYSKGYITTSDVNARTSMTISGKSISNLQGINYFSKLTWLDCSNNNLTDLYNVPTSLQTLYCQNNKITSFNYLQNCSSLKSLNCSNNQISSLTNLPTSIEFLDCSSNKFTILDFCNTSDHMYTKYYNLKTLNCSNNTQLTELWNSDFSTGGAALTSLNVSGCTSLTQIRCEYNKLTSLSSLPSSLKILNVMGNQLTSLATLPSGLETLSASSNKFTSFSLSNHSSIKFLQIGNNPNLTSLTINNNSKLEKVYAYYTTSSCTINCNNNSKLTLLNVEDSPGLKTLNCYGNAALTSLGVTNCSSLTTLDCHSNALTGIIGLYSCTALTTLDCGYNQLSSLDVSSLSNLTVLNCRTNKLTSLNVSNKTKLTQLEAQYNQLTSINVQGCSSLNYLMLESNKLSSLSVQGCNALRTINCCLNKISASGANTLINSLCTIPSGSQGALRYIFPGYSSASYVENNVNLTDAQVRSARNKRWMPYKFVSGTGWVEIPVNTAIPGDVNGDGHISSVDVTALYNYLLNNDSSDIVNGDQDGDGHISSVDVTVVYNILLGN